mmetsp:Transcript_45033/g.82310  ORF Transcript_45033/g.82310 Transcript_45033/m.82310 type:complete len:344 (-) Transcript_45033:118-1149(-)
MSHPDLAEFEDKWADIVKEFKLRDTPKKVSESESDPTAPIDWDIDGTPELESELKSVSVGDKIRFLNARPGPVQVAVDLALKVCKWRAAVQPRSVTASMMPNCMEQKVWRLGGWMKCGYPIALCNSGLWQPSKYYAVDEYIRYIGYVNEVLTVRMGEGVSRWVVVFDMSMFNPEMVRPVAMRCISNLAAITQEVHCERLAAAFFCFYNKVFYYSWKLIRPLVDKRTVRKVHWMQPKGATTIEESQDLKKWIDASQLETQFGGTKEDLWPALSGQWEVDIAVGSAKPPAFNPDAPTPLDETSEDSKPARPAFLDDEKLDTEYADVEEEVKKAAGEDEFADANED